MNQPENLRRQSIRLEKELTTPLQVRAGKLAFARSPWSSLPDGRLVCDGNIRGFRAGLRRLLDDAMDDFPRKVHELDLERWTREWTDSSVSGRGRRMAIEYVFEHFFDGSDGHLAIAIFEPRIRSLARVMRSYGFELGTQYNTFDELHEAVPSDGWCVVPNGDSKIRLPTSAFTWHHPNCRDASRKLVVARQPRFSAYVKANGEPTRFEYCRHYSVHSYEEISIERLGLRLDLSPFQAASVQANKIATVKDWPMMGLTIGAVSPHLANQRHYIKQATFLWSQAALLTQVNTAEYAFELSVLSVPGLENYLSEILGAAT